MADRPTNTPPAAEVPDQERPDRESRAPDRLSRDEASVARRLHVEGWAPEYGAPLDLAEERTAASPIDPTVETDRWDPIPGDATRAPELVAFVDGVRRIDARLTYDDPAEGPVPGIVGTFGVGATMWDRSVPEARFEELSVERVAVMARGVLAELGPLGGLPLHAESVGGDDPSELVRHFHGRMRAAEARLSSRLAARGTLVVADGPINELRAQPIVGFVKTHRVTYLGPEHGAVIARLTAGRRTPLFLIASEQFARYSWYLRLADLPDGHSWTGVVRCEAPTALGLDSVVELANCTAALLPRVASEGHIDPRAPQNLVPIAALERELRRRLGDQALVYRALRAAVRERRSRLADSPLAPGAGV